MDADLQKELLHHGVSTKDGYTFLYDGKTFKKNQIKNHLRKKASSYYRIIAEYWMQACQELNGRQKQRTDAIEGIDNIFLHSLTGLRRLLHLYPTIDNHDFILLSLRAALDSDINTFQYSTMSKIVEYKLGIEWLSHLLCKNLYVKNLIAHIDYGDRLQVEAKGVFGPYSNLDLPMKERVFLWADIDEEVRGRSRDLRNQSRYTMGLWRYNDPLINEGWTWRELRNEPYLFNNASDNPYPHRNLLWK